MDWGGGHYNLTDCLYLSNSESSFIDTRNQRKSGFFKVDLSGSVDEEVYNWNTVQAWFFVRFLHQSHTKPHLSGESYKILLAGKQLRVRISSVHETAPWCQKCDQLTGKTSTGRK